MIHGWSEHHAAVDLGLAVPLHCKVCRARNSVGLWLFYDWYAMAFVFGIVGRKTYAMACSACGARTPVSMDEVRGRQTRPAHIPFLRRYGLALVLGLPIAWVTLYLLSEWLEVLL